ncbi:hypothetical protein Taro_006649 [Colocasia esculenta]|uniref:RRM domain-containing protein n=1 Tax=Colocasia esculenta TaxID=4460 RepID=A0A843TVX4_COLES|nr:hypothetical protein [Colocasia esculenta]
MSSALDRSLEDLIKSNKKPGGGNARGSRGSGPGPARRAPNRSANRAAPYSAGKPAKAPDSTWQHDMYSDQAAAHPGPGATRAGAIETGTKLYISNLEFGVSNEDIKELFSEVGDLKRFAVHYDRSGRSKGTAEVVFSRRADAVAAVKRYNNVQLDGKPMKIDIVGTNIMTPAVPAKVTNGTSEKPKDVPKSGSGRSGGSTGSRGGGGGRRRGRGRKQKKVPSVAAPAEDAGLYIPTPHLSSLAKPLADTMMAVCV